MSLNERQEIIKKLDPTLLDIKWNKYIGYDEISPKQHTFLFLSHILEIFYGGSARGGKTISLLMAALQYVDRPEYRALLLGKTYTQFSMSGGLLDVAKAWLLKFPEVKYIASSTTFVFPSGATIKFGYLAAEDDKFNYQTTEFHFIGFDEVTNFTLTQYTFLFTRLTRRAGCTIPLRMRSASNPIGKGFEWVRDRFVKSPNTKDRLFLPASLWDNPFVDKEAYIKSLSNLAPVTRAKILNGDWEIREDSVLFKREWFKVITNELPGIADSIRVWDFAATEKKKGSDPSFTAGIKLNRMFDKVFWFSDLVRFQGSPKKVEEAVRNTAERDDRWVDIHIEQEPGSSGKALIDHYVRNILLGWSVYPVSPTGPKVVRAGPLASYTEKGHILWSKSVLTDKVMDEFLLFPEGDHTDCVDAAAHAFNILSQKPMSSNSLQIYNDIYGQKKDSDKNN